MDNPRNQDRIGKKELLILSFGTSFPESREKAIGAIENALEKAFPEYTVRRGFTSGMILRAIAKKENLEIDSFSGALERARKNGVEELIVQPTHMMNGLEYKKLLAAVWAVRNDFKILRLGAPLLTDDQDYDSLMQVLTSCTQEYQTEDTAIIFMGHGTEAAANHVYTRLQRKLHQAGWKHYFIGTVEASPTIEDVIQALPGNIRKVILHPLMVVAGDHANNDMAGPEEDSWKNILEARGYQVECILRGLGELEGIHAMYAEHVKNALDLESL